MMHALTILFSRTPAWVRVLIDLALGLLLLAGLLLWASETGRAKQKTADAERIAALQTTIQTTQTDLAASRLAYTSLEEARRADIAAREQEAIHLSALIKDSLTYRERVQNAPGASSQYRFSDPLYEFMRLRAGPDGDQPAANPKTSVDGERLQLRSKSADPAPGDHSG